METSLNTTVFVPLLFRLKLSFTSYGKRKVWCFLGGTGEAEDKAPRREQEKLSRLNIIGVDGASFSSSEGNTMRGCSSLKVCLEVDELDIRLGGDMRGRVIEIST